MPAEVPGAGAGARTLRWPHTPGLRPLSGGRELGDLHAATPAPPLSPASAGSKPDPGTAREVGARSSDRASCPTDPGALRFLSSFPSFKGNKRERGFLDFFFF